MLKSLALFAKFDRSAARPSIEKLDEVGVISKLRSLPESRAAITRLEDGKQLHAAYSLPLKDIRAGLVKYMLYRLYFDVDSKKLYLREAMKAIQESMPVKYRSLAPMLDLRIWAHHVPDLVIKPDPKVNPPDEYSPLVADRSGLVRMIAGAQVLASKLYVWCEKEPDDNFKDWIYQNRGLIHGSRTLVSAFQSEKEGITPVDFLLLFLHCLIDYKKELGEKILVRQDALPNRLCGVVRLYYMLQKCQDYMDRKDFKIESQSTHFDFTYSEQVFSTLNALSALNVIRMNLWGQKSSSSSSKKPDQFKEMYTCDVMESHIQETLLKRRSMLRLRHDITTQLRRIGEERGYLGEFQKLYGG